MTGTNVRIAGLGKFLPARVMDNHELEQLVDTSDEWIRKRTGIVERRIAAPDETSCTMAVAASRNALAMAGLDPSALDLIIVATGTPDHPGFPATGSLVQEALGAPRAERREVDGGVRDLLEPQVGAAELHAAADLQRSRVDAPAVGEDAVARAEVDDGDAAAVPLEPCVAARDARRGEHHVVVGGGAYGYPRPLAREREDPDLGADPDDEAKHGGQEL